MNGPSRARLFHGPAKQPRPPANEVKSINGRPSKLKHQKIDEGVIELENKYRRWSGRRHKFVPSGTGPCDKCNRDIGWEYHT